MTKVVAKFRHRDVEKLLQTLSAKKRDEKVGGAPANVYI